MSNKFLKKEYLIPLAIIIGTVIIGLSIYLGTSAEFRHKKSACLKVYGYVLEENPMKELYLQNCISNFDKLK